MLKLASKETLVVFQGKNDFCTLKSGKPDESHSLVIKLLFPELFYFLHVPTLSGKVSAFKVKIRKETECEHLGNTHTYTHTVLERGPALGEQDSHLSEVFTVY